MVPMLFVTIFQVVTNANVPLDILEILSWLVRNVKEEHVDALHLSNSETDFVNCQAVPVILNAQHLLNVSRLLEVSVTVLVPLDMKLMSKAIAGILMSVLVLIGNVVMGLFVKTTQDRLLAFVLKVPVETPTLESVHQSGLNVPRMTNVMKMSNAEMENANVHHHSISTTLMATVARVLVTDSIVVSMPNVLQLILLNVFANRASQAIH